MMKRNLLTIVFVLGSRLIFAQSDELQITLKNMFPIDYCTEPVSLGDKVGVAGPDSIDGLKISISNYVRGEDLLSFKSTANITGTWDESYGALILSGKANTADYEAAVGNIEYSNRSASPANGSRSLAVTLEDADYLPETGHFYKNISRVGISWTDAKTEAEALDYYGLQGYLATITSQKENNFIWEKVRGFGWIGASDALVEGEWQWVTGPESGTLFWRGNDPNGVSVGNRYSFWSTGEPNNADDGEYYAHINQNPDKEERSWNDLPDEGGTGYYKPQGYIAEFGDMAGDPGISLSAALEINVWNILFDEGIEKTICRNDTVRLNHEFAGNYEWFPKTGLDDPFRSDPLAFPVDTTVYKVVCRDGTCVDSAFFTVNVKPVPLVDLGDDQNICEGMTTDLDAGKQASYEWNTGYGQQILNTGESGTYHVRVGNEFSCYTEDEVELSVHAYPEIDLSATDTLFCDQKQGTVKVNVDKGQVEWFPVSGGLTFSSNSAQTEAIVLKKGTYKTLLTVTDNYGCQSGDSLTLGFYETPGNQFSINDTTCSGYNVRVHYEGDGSDEAIYNWYFSDSLYASGKGKKELDISLGFDKQDGRELGLMVNEGGCLSQLNLEHIKVIPNLEISVLDDEGCEPFFAEFTAKTTETVPDENFTWYFGDSISVKKRNPKHSYQSSGFYDVGLRIVSDEGCENYGLIEDMIKVHPVPTVATSLDPDSCYSDILEVKYTGSANSQDTYHWDLSALDPEEILQDPGDMQGPLLIRLLNKPASSIGLQISSEYHCESDWHQFSFKRKPRVELTSDIDEGCPPLEVSFEAIPRDSLDKLTYQWHVGQPDEFTSGGSKTKHVFYTSDRQFEVKSIVKSSVTGCIDTVWLSAPIKVYPKPTALFRADTNEVSIVQAEFNFWNLSENAQNYYWDFGDSIGFSAEFEPTYRYSKMGWFDVELFVENEFFCADSASQRVLVAFDQIFPPNAFNPNSPDPINREFLLAPEGVAETGYHMQIFNRWGERIFQANDEFIGWDGKMKNGQLAPTGVYTWVLAYQDFLGRNHRQQGAVTLVY